MKPILIGLLCLGVAQMSTDLAIFMLAGPCTVKLMTSSVSLSPPLEPV